MCLSGSFTSVSCKADTTHQSSLSPNNNLTLILLVPFSMETYIILKLSLNEACRHSTDVLLGSRRMYVKLEPARLGGSTGTGEKGGGGGGGGMKWTLFGLYAHENHKEIGSPNKQ